VTPGGDCLVQIPRASPASAPSGPLRAELRIRLSPARRSRLAAHTLLRAELIWFRNDDAGAHDEVLAYTAGRRTLRGAIPLRRDTNAAGRSTMTTGAEGSALPWVEAIARSFEPIAFDAFHRDRLPALVARHGSLVARDLDGAAPLAFRVGSGAAYTWLPSPDGLRVAVGDAAAETVVALDERVFSEFVHQLVTASGAVMTGRASLVRGSLAGWQRFEPALQSLCEGREIYGPRVWETLVDRDGKPLDLRRRFSVDDDREELRHFFEVAGYLHLRAVFRPDEVERFGREVEHARSKTTPGDPFSWWSVDASGREVVTRINYLGRHSPELQALSHDPRLARFARLAGETLRVCDDRLDGPMVFIKNSNVVKGNGDLGWHVDDGIGGHQVMCPLIQAGIQLDRANPENGQLKVLAGSHRYSKHWIGWGEEGNLPDVALETEPGDLTLHFGDAMHAHDAANDRTGRRSASALLQVRRAEDLRLDSGSLSLQRRALPAGRQRPDGESSRDRKLTRERGDRGLPSLSVRTARSAARERALNASRASAASGSRRSRGRGSSS